MTLPHRISGPSTSATLSALLPLLVLLSPGLLWPVSAQCSLCFSQTNYEETIPENTDIGDAILTVSASSGIPGDTVMYSLVGVSNGIFTINNVSGDIFLSQPPTVMTHDFFASAQSMLSMVLETIMVRIVVTAVQDPPSCSPDLLFQAIPEGQNTSIRLNCASAGNSALDYEIVSGNDASVFQVSVLGTVSANVSLDHEQQSVYQLGIAVTAGGSTSTTVTVLIAVLPVNEFQPLFLNNSFEYEVIESAPIGTTVGQVVATDEDRGMDGEVTYALQMNAQIPFLLNKRTGELVLAQSVDFHNTNSFSFGVLATDDSPDPSLRMTSTSSVVVRVLDANDHSPEFTKTVYYGQVTEECAVADIGDEIVLVSCSDGDTGINGEVVYSIVSGGDGGEFSIDSATGSITLDLAACDLDFESGVNSFELFVQCEDQGQPTLTGEAVVIIEVTGYNEFFPIPLSVDTEASVPEDTAIGAYIAQVLGSDGDTGSGGVITYSITDPYCPEGLLYMNPSTGEVYLTAPLDYDSGPETVFCTVTLTDGQDPFHDIQADLCITVTDVNDEPPGCSPSFHATAVPEDTPTGSNILSFSCDDPDSASLEFSITNTSPLPFTVNSTGREAVLIVDSQLDADRQADYKISVRVTDGRFETNMLLLVSVSRANDNSPVFSRSSYSCNVSEVAAIGTTVCETGAEDADSGRDGSLTYSLTGGEESFAVDFTTGSIVLAGNIDFETTPSYELTVEVVDSGMPSLNSSAVVHIDILGSNEHKPTVQPLVFLLVAENTPHNTTVTALTCTDSDAGASGEVEFTITETSALLVSGSTMTLTHSPLTINSSGGVTVSGDIDYEVTQQYQVMVVCEDHGVPQLQSYTRIIVDVSPENEVTPHFSESTQTVTVAENTAVGTSVLQVLAEDEDRGRDGQVHYTLDDLAPAFLAIDHYSGVLTVIQTIDCMHGTDYFTEIEARDEGTPPQSSSTMLTLHITNCSLGQVLPQQSTYTASVSETAPVGTPTLTVSCRGSREPATGLSMVDYHLAPEAGSLFDVNSTGEISLADSLDYESSTLQQVKVECYDPHLPSMAASVTVYISILPVNEHPPTFLSLPYHVDLPESTALASVVAQITAVDADRGEDGELLYSIEEVDSPFRIDPHSGTVYLTSQLDREGPVSSYNLTVMVRDRPSGPREGALSAITRLTVQVLDSNDHQPQCERAFLHVTLTALSVVGDKLVSPVCRDGDFGPPNSDIVFSIENTSLAQDFSIDATTGEMILSQAVDAERAVVYSIPITVRDRGDPPLSTIVTVIADVRDKVADIEPATLPVNLPVANLTEREGELNAASMLLQDITLKLWEESAEVRFQMALARSVTHYCALLPLACSLVTGCAEFFGNTRKRSSEPYASFAEPNVVVLGDPTEVSQDGSRYLEVNFYVLLPEAAPLSPTRETNFVIPRGTLKHILQEDTPVIEAWVRDNVDLQGTVISDEQKATFIAVGASFAVVVSVLLIALPFCAVYNCKLRNKKRQEVVPLAPPLAPPRRTHSSGSIVVVQHRSRGSFTWGSGNRSRRPSSPDHETTPLGWEWTESLDSRGASMAGNDGGTPSHSISSLGGEQSSYQQDWSYQLPGAIGPVRQGQARTQEGWGQLRH